ncbi:NUDIX hydrolase [Hippea sp. KM1]|uniref:NUDIX hydrolase n=1 Tax=Hippea sp. KM1 TaxID=944481 RepID=UPI00046D21CC|nr:CoA pyrophosphatase [Hippea sp. KM1]
MLIEKLKSSLNGEHSPISTNAKESAVIIPLLKTESGWLVIFEKKPSYDRLHPSQISFPGGSREEKDKTFIDTAVRETEEELGIKRQNIEIIGAVEPTKTLTTNFIIYPFVGLIRQNPPYSINTQEVEKIIFIPLDYLIDNSPIPIGIYTFRGRQRKTPMLNYKGEIIWGATARILNKFIPIVKSIL